MGAPGESGGRVVTPPPVYVEQADPLAPALGAAAANVGLSLLLCLASVWLGFGAAALVNR